MPEAMKVLIEPGVSAGIERLVYDLESIRRDMIDYALKIGELTSQIHSGFRDSATNLLHYLALRRRDMRHIQSQLALLGLSSLGRSEAHVLANIDAVLRTLGKLAGKEWIQPSKEHVLSFIKGRKLLKEHTEMLLGPVPKDRHVRIMVTMPSQAADDYKLVKNLVEAGMDCARINCAHDDEEVWSKMIANIRKAAEETGKPCKIMMDLAGPKIRTGAIVQGEKVTKIRPERDVFGRMVKPARIILAAKFKDGVSYPAGAHKLTVPPVWLKGLKVGDRISFKDATGASKGFIITKTESGFCEAESAETSYVIPGTVLSYRRGKGKERKAVVGDMKPLPNSILLKKGDMLILKRDETPGKPAAFDAEGNLAAPAEIGCALPEVINDIRKGEEIWFDDGKIGGIIEAVETRGAMVRICLGRERIRLREDKGINLPMTDLRLPSLTEKDRQDLPFIVGNADIVALSFARTAKDIELLKDAIDKIDGKSPAIIIKVETRLGFENLPAMLLSAMIAPCCGVMIARGDLAVECGFERMAEVQEEILWLCEAAHVPVIWATQVLESMARDGLPSRAEITDAAMGNRAECVMLNKGPFIIRAVEALSNILKRMQGHQSKKQAMLRELKLANTLLGI